MSFPRKYPVGHDALIRQLKSEGLPSREIAARLGRSFHSIESALRRLQKAKRINRPARQPNAYQKPQPAPVTLSPRSCLSCRTSFPSFGIGNRICDPCKRHEAWA